MEINALQILFQLINFGVVFVALSYFLYRPIIKIIDDRRNKTEESRKAAEDVLKEKDQIDVLKKKTKVQAEKEAEAILDDARSDAKELKAKLTTEVRAEISDLRSKELKKLESEQQAIRDHQEKQVSSLSVAIAAKVIGKEVDEKTHRSLIADALKDLAKA